MGCGSSKTSALAGDADRVLSPAEKEIMAQWEQAAAAKKKAELRAVEDQFNTAFVTAAEEQLQKEFRAAVEDRISKEAQVRPLSIQLKSALLLGWTCEAIVS